MLLKQVMQLEIGVQKNMLRQGDAFNNGINGLKSGARKYLQEKVLDPIKPIIEPIGRKAQINWSGIDGCFDEDS